MLLWWNCPVSYWQAEQVVSLLRHFGILLPVPKRSHGNKAHDDIDPDDDQEETLLIRFTRIPEKVFIRDSVDSGQKTSVNFRVRPALFRVVLSCQNSLQLCTWFYPQHAVTSSCCHLCSTSSGRTFAQTTTASTTCRWSSVIGLPWACHLACCPPSCQSVSKWVAWSLCGGGGYWLRLAQLKSASCITYMEVSTLPWIFSY